MKIQDLITKLQAMNPNSDVVFDDGEEFMDFQIVQADDHGDHALVTIYTED